MKNFASANNLIAYLEASLIPDLRDSGSEATADDFEDCVEAIRELQGTTTAARKLIHSGKPAARDTALDILDASIGDSTNG